MTTAQWPQADIASHGLFHMENAGGCKPTLLSTAAEEHQPSCFALEEEKGESWNGNGAMGPPIKEARQSL